MTFIMDLIILTHWKGNERSTRLTWKSKNLNVVSSSDQNDPVEGFLFKVGFLLISFIFIKVNFIW